MKKQAGFTLIELIAVIVVLGIIAAVAVPRFVDLSNQAEQASVNATAQSIASASALNYAKAAVNQATGSTTDPHVGITACDGGELGALMVGGDLSAYTIDGDDSLALGDEGACTIEGANGQTASFVIIGAP